MKIIEDIREDGCDRCQKLRKFPISSSLSYHQYQRYSLEPSSYVNSFYRLASSFLWKKNVSDPCVRVDDNLWMCFLHTNDINTVKVWYQQMQEFELWKGWVHLTIVSHCVRMQQWKITSKCISSKFMNFFWPNISAQQ